MVNYDLILVIGIVLAILAVPAMLSSLLEGSAPRASAITVMIAGGLILTAVTLNPIKYKVNQIPAVFERVALSVLQ